jgi:RecB family endonuclease NucS
MTGQDQDQVKRAVDACRRAGLPVIGPAQCTCSLRGRLVVRASAHRLEVLWPYDRPCPIHGHQHHVRPMRSLWNRPGRSPSQAARGLSGAEDGRSMSLAITEAARELAALLVQRLSEDVVLAKRLAAAQELLRRANDRLW